MNIELIDKVIAAIRDEKNSVGFDITIWYSEGGGSCGTVACIAGHTLIQDGWSADQIMGAAFECVVCRYAAKALGIDRYSASKLFAPSLLLGIITADHAIKMLEWLKTRKKVSPNRVVAKWYEIVGVER